VRLLLVPNRLVSERGGKKCPEFEGVLLPRKGLPQALQPFSKRVNLSDKGALSIQSVQRLGTLRVSTSGTILFENCSRGH
jgi:hypothetical protein